MWKKVTQWLVFHCQRLVMNSEFAHGEVYHRQRLVINDHGEVSAR